MSRKALGRGLKALIPESEPATESALVELDVEQVLPGRFQPRQGFDQERIQELARSIRSRGVIQPVIVKKADSNRYELIAGERRWRAAREAGLKTIPALVRTAGDPEALELALIENLQRENLNPIESARAYQQLIETFDLTQEEVAEQVGKDRSSVANHLRLLRLPSEIQEDLFSGKLSMGHARALLSLSSKEKQLSARRTVLSRGLSVRETETLIRRLAGEKKKATAKKTKKDIYIIELEDSIRRALGTKVSVVPKGSGGVIEVSYYSVAELERLAGHLTEGR